MLGEETTEWDPLGGHKARGAPYPPGLVGPLAIVSCPSSAIRKVLMSKKSEGSFQDKAPPSRGGTWAEPI